jgi:hypothetical protein
VLKDLLEELQSREVPPRPPRDWLQIFVTALPGLAAAIALIFTWLSINATKDATNRQLEVAEQGQVTDRYNAAITNLGSSSVDVRLGGIYALQLIMQDSPRDQPTVVAVLCAFIRDHATAANRAASSLRSSATSRPPTDIQAALTVVSTRKTAYDGSTTVVDLTNAYLLGANLPYAHLSGAHLRSVNLAHAYMPGAHLFGADLLGTIFIRANLTSADFRSAQLSGAKFNGAILIGVKGLPPGTPRSQTGGTPASTSTYSSRHSPLASFAWRHPRPRTARCLGRASSRPCTGG